MQTIAVLEDTRPAEVGLRADGPALVRALHHSPPPTPDSIVAIRARV